MSTADLEKRKRYIIRLAIEMGAEWELSNDFWDFDEAFEKAHSRVELEEDERLGQVVERLVETWDHLLGDHLLEVE